MFYGAGLYPPDNGLKQAYTDRKIQNKWLIDGLKSLIKWLIQPLGQHLTVFNNVKNLFVTVLIQSDVYLLKCLINHHFSVMACSWFITWWSQHRSPSYLYAVYDYKIQLTLASEIWSCAKTYFYAAFIIIRNVFLPFRCLECRDIRTKEVFEHDLSLSEQTVNR